MAAEYLRLGYAVIEVAASILAALAMALAIFWAMNEQHRHAIISLVSVVVNMGTILACRALQ